MNPFEPLDLGRMNEIFDQISDGRMAGSGWPKYMSETVA